MFNIKSLKIMDGSPLLISKRFFGIHGINPKLTYEPTGKTFELPRFCSIEMQQARQMNKIVIGSIKNSKPRTYSKASPQDLKQLTSTTIEDSYSRVEWINPKDGKVYNLLKQGESEDGKVLVRILDEEGAFIKEAALVPKTIMIPDNYLDPTEILNIPHGELVMAYAKRNNPFARYQKVQVEVADLYNNKEIDNIRRKIYSKGEPDYISCSYGTKVYQNSKLKIPKNMLKRIFSATKGYDDIASRKCRVLCSANNASPLEYSEINKLSNSILAINSKVEGVGALADKTAKISQFSMSRNSEMTQHYELGEFTPTITKDGLNITGIAGTDFPFPGFYLERVSKNPFLNKPVDKVKKLIKIIDMRIKELQKEKYAIFGENKSIAELQQKCTEIERKIELYTKRRIKINTYLNELSNVNGRYNVRIEKITGTSFSTPIRTAKLALNDMMEGVI